MRRWQFWMHNSKAHNFLRIHTMVLGGYSVLACVLTWPLLRLLMTHVPGDGIDDPSLAWNLWWLKSRLIDQRNLDIFHSDWMFFPIEINLGFYTLTPLNGLLSIPLQTGLNLTVASNLILLSSYVLGGYGTFLLLRYLLSGDWKLEARKKVDQKQPISAAGGLIASQSWLVVFWSAFAAGVVYAFASSKLFYASLGQFNIASSGWIPFVILYTLRTGQTRHWRDAILASLFLTFQAWAELTYASFLLIFIAIFFVWHLLTVRYCPGRLQQFSRSAAQSLTANLQSLLPPFLLMGFTFLLGLLPFLWAMIPDLLSEGDFFASGGGFADIFSADIMGYLAPTRLHPLLGMWATTLPFPNDKGQQIFVGYSALLLGLAGAVYLLRLLGWRGLFWPLTALWFWWLTLGPEIRWGGHATGIPGPFTLISQLPFFSGNRYPSRYSVLLMLCMAVLVGWGGAWVLGKLLIGTGGLRGQRRQGAMLQSLFSLLFIGLFLFEHLTLPLPLNDFRVPSIYWRIAAQPEDMTLLELPTGWRNGARVMGKSDVLIMMEQWYQTVHGKRRLGGNTSRNPGFKFDYFNEAPLIGDLIKLMNADAQIDGRAYLAPAIEANWEDLISRNREIAPFVLDFLNVHLITLHLEKSPPALIRFVEEALPVTLIDEWTGSNNAGEKTTIRLYRVDVSRSHEEWQLDLGSSLGRLFAAEGWSPGVQDQVRYATRREADLLLDLPTEGGRLTFQLYGPAELGRLLVNGVPLHWRVLDQVGEALVVEVQVPPTVANEPVDRLALRFNALYPLQELWRDQTTGWSIGTTGIVLPADRPLFVRSAGKDAGDVAQIFVAGRDVARNALGYNLAALTSEGQVLESVAFNTLISPAESVAMANWLAHWPAGTIIAGAVRDEASYNLGEDAVAALRRVGVDTDLRGRFRGSHAFIGVIGALPASAAESFAPFRQATATAGPSIDAEQISGGIGRIEFSSLP